MKKETTNKKMVMVDNDQLTKLVILASEAVDCLYEYAGDDSETYKHLKTQLDKWKRFDYK
jgi:hypothetical protein